MPLPFREKTPTRRPDRSPCKHYNSYKKTLREDFDYRCGYCGSFDKIKTRSFAIDHFIPQKPDGFKHSLSPTDYYNLVYSCAYCNLAKSNKWPTNDVSKPNDGTSGFVDPANVDYDSLFQRDEHGFIIQSDTTNKLSLYIKTELKLGVSRHALLWKLEKVDVAIAKISEVTATIENEDLKKSLIELKSRYYDLTQELYKGDM